MQDTGSASPKSHSISEIKVYVFCEERTPGSGSKRRKNINSFEHDLG